tara:strand:- start:232 stop:555 length:324 start_codon:yes stop_codon:yes gene_type:complete
VLSQLSYSPTRTTIINTYLTNYNYLSLGSSEKYSPTLFDIGATKKTIGVPIAQPTIQALTQSEILGGNWPVLIAVIKKLIRPVMKVERTKVEITVATVNVKVLFLFI